MQHLTTISPYERPEPFLPPYIPQELSTVINPWTLFFSPISTQPVRPGSLQCGDQHGLLHLTPREGTVPVSTVWVRNSRKMPLTQYALRLTRSPSSRYCQPEEQPISSPDAANGLSPRSSNDPILTAFAQLGALRLNAKRGLITLSSISREFVIAESGQSLSLQLDNDEKDRLWHGAGPLHSSFGRTPGPALTSFFCESPHESFAFIPDLRDDDRFKDTP